MLCLTCTLVIIIINAEVAIENGMSLGEVLTQVQVIRGMGCKTPIILFTYLNPILALGYNKFCYQAKELG